MINVEMYYSGGGNTKITTSHGNTYIFYEGKPTSVLKEDVDELLHYSITRKGCCGDGPAQKRYVFSINNGE
jgi:hypothetical protein